MKIALKLALMPQETSVSSFGWAVRLKRCSRKTCEDFHVELFRPKKLPGVD